MALIVDSPAQQLSPRARIVLVLASTHLPKPHEAPPRSTPRWPSIAPLTPHPPNTPSTCPPPQFRQQHLTSPTGQKQFSTVISQGQSGVLVQTSGKLFIINFIILVRQPAKALRRAVGWIWERQGRPKSPPFECKQSLAAILLSMGQEHNPVPPSSHMQQFIIVA